ncbi:TPA: type II toxin-antitoxin system HicA family toxin [Candidatus Micrarchaeota archaeon]|nr:type II toxin-antitoxin system HicA family toxin [Candidatus Micrarchaeota archaeon]
MKLPTDVSGSDLTKVAVKLGFEIRRQSGSHLILKKEDKLLVIPQHRQLKKGTLLQILRILEISKEDLARLLLMVSL